jgi:UDPglucose 6-dehydrogenase
MSATREPIAVIGTGYVGLVTAAGFAELGSEVFCVDVDADKIAGLREGRVPIYEPGLEESLATHRERLHFSTELRPALESARLLFVCVGTPSTYSGDADLSAVRAVVDAMPASDRHALVMKSTVPPGTGAAIKRELASQGKGLAYVSCPEFLREGSALADFRSPDRIVVGDDRDWAGDAVLELYSPIDAPVVRTDIVSAEMVKLASNAFLTTKISFINEIANVCEETGADVTEVARGMGLDARIGPSFLQAGIGYGGSCLPGEETVLVRQDGRSMLLSFEELWKRLEAIEEPLADDLHAPGNLQVLSWDPAASSAIFLPVSVVTRRQFEGELVEVRTKMGRRVRCTPDHPFVVSEDGGNSCVVKLAKNLTSEDWVPVAQGIDHPVGLGDRPLRLSLLASPEIQTRSEKIRVRVPAGSLDVLDRVASDRRTAILSRHTRKPSARVRAIRDRSTLWLDEAFELGVAVSGADLASASPNASFVRETLELDNSFWRVVGLYLAEGCSDTASGVQGHITWSFHREHEQHLADQVMAYWQRQGVEPKPYLTPTSLRVTIWSRLLADWWTHVLGMGRTSYTQRLPDLVWEQSKENKRALLSGLWEGDGSWSFVNEGPSVVLEFGTVSRELADGTLRLLGDLGLMASQRVGRTPKSTVDTYWLRISGATQVEAAIEFVEASARERVLDSLRRLKRRTAPTGYRRADNGAWVRVRCVSGQPFSGPVYSLEVPGTHTFVTSGGLVVDNCFPKDVNALKQVAGNTGYHFQVLGAVIEVNELQKRRVVAKLQKHVGDLVGKCVTLLGLSFKPNTDDMREASSLVLAGRLHAEGAEVRAYDPVAEAKARELMPGVEFASSALDALQGADACVLVTEWPEFLELDWNEAAKRMAGTLVVDGRNALDPEVVNAAGLIYEGVGRR